MTDNLRDTMVKGWQRAFSTRGGAQPRAGQEILPVVILDGLEQSPFGAARRWMVGMDNAAAAGQFSYCFIFNNAEKNALLTIDHISFRMSAVSPLKISGPWDSTFNGINPTLTTITPWEVGAVTSAAGAGLVSNQIKQVQAGQSQSATDNGSSFLYESNDTAWHDRIPLGLCLAAGTGYGFSPAIFNGGLAMTVWGRLWEAF